VSSGTFSVGPFAPVFGLPQRSAQSGPLQIAFWDAQRPILPTRLREDFFAKFGRAWPPCGAAPRITAAPHRVLPPCLKCAWQKGVRNARVNQLDFSLLYARSPPRPPRVPALRSRPLASARTVGLIVSRIVQPFCARLPRAPGTPSNQSCLSFCHGRGVAAVPVESPHLAQMRSMLSKSRIC
jgi:hypothetical protein